jgi:hypothetical protein
MHMVVSGRSRVLVVGERIASARASGGYTNTQKTQGADLLLQMTLERTWYPAP